LRKENIERKRAEEAARRSEKELRAIIETIPATVWSTLPDAVVEFVNQRGQAFTGLPLEDALGWCWEAVVHPDDQARFVADWRATATTPCSIFRALRLACEFQIPVYVRHRIQAIDHKIHEDLLQLHANLP